MDLQELIATLDCMGVKVSDTTVRKYIAQELIQPSVRRSRGRNQGQLAEFPDNVLEEAYAAFKMLNGAEVRFGLEIVQQARKRVREIEANNKSFITKGWDVPDYAMHRWRELRKEAKEKLMDLSAAEIEQAYLDNCE